MIRMTGNQLVAAPERERSPPPAAAIEPPPRPQIPYGLHPLIDLQLMMNALAENQARLAKSLRWQAIAVMILALSFVLSEGFQ
jgi:hypothetical protein